MGFFGVRPLMLIGDQPSTDPWPETHPGRVLLYGTLIKLGVPDAHLTDVIKRRGKGSESRKRLPADFPLHLDLLRREIGIIQPFRIVALALAPNSFCLSTCPRSEKTRVESGTSPTERAPVEPRVSRRNCGRRLCKTLMDVRPAVLDAYGDPLASYPHRVA